MSISNFILVDLLTPGTEYHTGLSVHTSEMEEEGLPLLCHYFVKHMRINELLACFDRFIAAPSLLDDLARHALLRGIADNCQLARILLRALLEFGDKSKVYGYIACLDLFCGNRHVASRMASCSIYFKLGSERLIIGKPRNTRLVSAYGSPRGQIRVDRGDNASVYLY